MALKETASIDVGYPILDAKFINNKTVLVAGGGGEGNNGIPNKITAIKCSFKVNDAKRRLQKFREVVLPPNEDSPQCIDVARLIDENEYNVVVGCNQSSELIRSMNINNNVRKYTYNKEEHLIFDDAAQFEEEISGDVDEYPKVVKISQDNSVGCLMTSTVPSVLYFFSPDVLESKFKYKPPGNEEIKDFALSPKTGSTLCYITSSSIVSISTQTNSIIATTKTSPIDKKLQKYIFSKIKFINDNEVVISYSVKGGKGAGLLRYDLTKQKIVQEQVIAKKLNNIVALDVSVPQDLVAFAGNDLVVYIVKLSNFKLMETIKKLHPFAITSVSFSPNGTKLATGSAANILNVVRVPPKYASGKSVIGTLFQYLFTIILIAALGIGIQKAHENGQLDGILESSKHFSKNYREVGLYYGKMGTELASEYGKLGLELAENYGRKAYAVAEEYGSKYGSKAMELYKEKFGKDDIVQDVSDQAKSTLNDVVQEVTRDLHAETIDPDFNSETLDDIKLSTGVIESSTTSIASPESPSVEASTSESVSEMTFSETTTEVSTASSESTVAIPEFESIHEIVNNATVVDEAQQYSDPVQVSENSQVEHTAAPDADAEDEEYVIEEVVYEESEPVESDITSDTAMDQEGTDIPASDSGVDDDHVEVIEVVEEVVEESDPKPEPTKDQREHTNEVTPGDTEYTEVVEEVYEEVIEEVIDDSDSASSTQEVETSTPSQVEKPEEVVTSEEAKPLVNTEAPAQEPTEANKISEQVQEPVQESEPVTSEAQQSVPNDESELIADESIKTSLPNVEEVQSVVDEKVESHSENSASQESTTTAATTEEIPSQSVKNYEASAVTQEQAEEIKSAEDSNADGATTQSIDEEIVQEPVQSEPVQSEQIEVQSSSTPATSIASDVSEETFTAQSVDQEPVVDKQEHTPEEPVSFEEPHTVEVSGTGGVDPTPKPDEPESVEEPPVSVSTPSTEAVAADQNTSVLSPSEEEASSIKPTGSTTSVAESSHPVASLSSSPSSSAKKKTKVVTRTVKKPKTADPTPNAREKDEL
ncbi:SED4 [Candida metapsilosis]|uniref:Guanine nucleotide-exchange factor SEC12 n=1 Tax=Candida metapsilosis TaxID=273372 RepID=A0A8H7ZDB8_9ASCO|nr:SED4 [Candida metapsilosis]